MKSGILAEGCLYARPTVMFGLLLSVIISAQQDSTKGILNFMSALGTDLKLLGFTVWKGHHHIVFIFFQQIKANRKQT